MVAGLTNSQGAKFKGPQGRAAEQHGGNRVMQTLPTIQRL